MKEKTKYVVLSIIGTMWITAVGLGVSYGLWSLNHVQENPNVINTACFNVSYTSLSENLNLTNQYPIDDYKGEYTTPYRFKITNNCGTVVNYTIALDILSTTTIDLTKVKMSLHGNSDIEARLISTLETEEYVESGIVERKRIISGIIPEGEETYELRVWIDEGAGVESHNKTLDGKIVVTTSPNVTPCATCGTLMVSESEPLYTDELYLDAFLGSPSPVIRGSIESIEFVDYVNIPNDVIGTWDVSEAQDGTVTGWYTDTDNDSKYEIIVGSSGGVKANPDSNSLFSGLINLNVLKLEHFYTEDVINMSNMFVNTGEMSMFTLDLGDNNVTNMSNMFAGAGEMSSTFTLDLGDNFDTSNVTNMSGMFASTLLSASSIFTIDVSKFDTSNVTDMSYMFSFADRGNPNFTIDVSNFDTSKVTDMTGMFGGFGNGSSNITLDLRNFNFSALIIPDIFLGISDPLSNISKIYASDSNIDIIVTLFGYAMPSLSTTIINCTTDATLCP